MSDSYYDDSLDVSGTQLASSGDRVPDGEYEVTISECKQHRSTTAGTMFCIVEFRVDAIKAGGEAMAATGTNGQPKPAAKVGHTYSQASKRDAETGRKDLKAFLYAGAQCELGQVAPEEISVDIWRKLGAVFGLDNPWAGVRLALSVHTKPQVRDPSKSFTHMRWAPLPGQQTVSRVGGQATAPKTAAPAPAPRPAAPPPRPKADVEPAGMGQVIEAAKDWAEGGQLREEAHAGLREWAAQLGVVGQWFDKAIDRAYAPF